MKDIFAERNENYNIISRSSLQLPKAKTKICEIESVSFSGQRHWHAIPKNIKQSEHLTINSQEKNTELDRLKLQLSTWKHKYHRIGISIVYLLVLLYFSSRLIGKWFLYFFWLA